MALVDYSSDSSSASEPEEVDPKRQKTSHGGDSEALPPLPSAFHDLYASTVRVSASDDPALHQGRKRVNPHKVGNWPSHVYIEWHPTPKERATLTTLLTTLQQSLPTPTPITSFLTSDLGAPQPLHISLSRPIVFSTAQKEAFLSQLSASIQDGGIAPFALVVTGVEWHRTEESARSFLVLRVSSPSSSGGEDVKKVKDGKENTNPQLMTLLDRTNTIVTSFEQPALYATAASIERPDRAFHVSIAWSFAEPTAEMRRVTEEAFGALRSGNGGKEEKGKEKDNEENKEKETVQSIQVPVDGIKVKIGNVVTHVPLSDTKGRRKVGKQEGGRGLFGI